MAEYVDGFVIPVPSAKVEEYRGMAEKARAIWLEHGAVSYHECVLEDATAKECVSFPQLAGAKEGETVIFAWIGYASREDRDAVNAKVMADRRMQEMMAAACPFECHRMAYGGFRRLV